MRKSGLLTIFFLAISGTIVAQTTNFNARTFTNLQEGEMKAGYHNIPHIGRTNYIGPDIISFGSEEHAYIYFSSMVVGAKVVDKSTGEKFAITIPSAFRTSTDGMESWTLNPVEGYNNPNFEPYPSIARSSDPNTWPTSWNGVWKGYYGDGETRSTEELMFVSTGQTMTKFIDNYKPFDDQPELGGLGLEIKTHVFAWNTSSGDAYVAMGNTHIVIHEITNISDKDLDSLFIGNWVADFINGGGSDDQHEFDEENASLLLYDDTGIGVAAIKVLEYPSDGLLVNKFGAGALYVNEDEAVYKQFAYQQEPDNSGDTDLTLSTTPFSLNSGNSITISYAYTIEETGETVGENKTIINNRLDYISQSYESKFTLDNIDEISLNNDEAPTVIPIAEARQLPDDSLVTVKGIVTRTKTTLTYLQQDTAAVVIYSGPSTALYTAIQAGQVATGDSIQITGNTHTYDGVRELDGIQNFEVFSRGNPLPEPVVMTLSELNNSGHKYESELIRIENLKAPGATFFSSNFRYDISNIDSTLYSTLWVGGTNQADLYNVPIPDLFTYEGILYHYASTGNQLRPFYKSDIISVEPSKALDSLIIPNGNFEDAITGMVTDGYVNGWKLWLEDSQLADFEIIDDEAYDGQKSLAISIDSLGSIDWSIQVANYPFIIEPGAEYSYSVWAKTGGGGATASFTVGDNDSYDEWHRLSNNEVTITSEWQEYTFDFEASFNGDINGVDTLGKAATFFSYSGNEGKTIYLDNLKIEKKSSPIINPSLLDYVSEVRGDTLVVKDYVAMGNVPNSLADVVELDTGAPDTRVYELVNGGLYLLNKPIQVTDNRPLTIAGEDNSPILKKTSPIKAPIIVGTDEGGSDLNSNLLQYTSNTMVKNVIMGAHSTSGENGWTFFYGEASDVTLTLDNVYMEHNKWVFISTYGSYSNNSLKISDSYFVNMSGQGTRRNGGVYDVVNNPTNDLWVENSTFINAGGMLFKFRQYPFNKAVFNHNTFVNISNSVFETFGYQVDLMVTNNLFVNTNVQTYYPGLDLNETDQDLLPTGIINVDTLGGLNNSVSLSVLPPAFRSAPETDWPGMRKILVDKNVAFWSPELSDIVSETEALHAAILDTLDGGKAANGLQSSMMTMNTRTQAMFDNDAMWPYLTEGDWLDAGAPGFVEDFGLMDINAALGDFKAYSMASLPISNTMILSDIRTPGNPSTVTGNYAFSDWPIPFDLSYTNPTYINGGLNGYPVGDLNWYPDRKAEWDAQRDAEYIALETAKNDGITLDETPIVVIPRPPYAVGDTINYNGSFAHSELGEFSATNWYVNTDGATWQIVDNAQDGDSRALQFMLNTYNGSGNDWENEAGNMPIYVQEADLLGFSVWLKADTDNRIARLTLSLPESGNWKRQTQRDVKLSTNWKLFHFYNYQVVAKDEVDGMRAVVALNFPENEGGIILIDNLQIIKRDSLEDGNYKWTQKADFPGSERIAATGFSVQGEGYIGTGGTGIAGYFTNDFWKYNPDTGTWIQISDFPGVERGDAASFSINGRGYIGTGSNGIDAYNDFWEYNPITDTWLQKEDVPGPNRRFAVAFSIEDRGYFGMGINMNDEYFSDLWEYDSSTNLWAEKASFPGELRKDGVFFVIDKKAYYGFGFNGDKSFNDLWEYDLQTDTWSELETIFPGYYDKNASVGFELNGKGYIGTGWSSTIKTIDFWEFNPVNNTWQEISSFKGIERNGAVGFEINGKGYVGTGWDGITRFNDFWELEILQDSTQQEFATTITGTEGWRMLSTPTSNNSYQDLLNPIWTQGIANGADATSGFPNVLNFDGSAFNAVSDLTTTMTPGSGFITYIFSDDDYDQTEEDAGFPKSLSTTGTENSGDISPVLNEGETAWTLVGNPFGSTIDADLFTTSDLSNVYYVYDHNYGVPAEGDSAAEGSAGSYRVWNGIAGSLTDGIIAPFQGFWVQNTGGEPALTISKEDTTSGGVLFKESTPSPALKLTAMSNGRSSEAWFSFSEEGSIDLDNRDAYKLSPLDQADYVSLSSVLNDQLFAINNLPVKSENLLEIPLDLHIFEAIENGWESINGLIALSAEEINAIPENWSITLLDNQTGKVFDLRTNEVLEFELIGELTQKLKRSIHPEDNIQKRKSKTEQRFVLGINQGVTTGIDENELPEEFALSQNYPNPFNPATTISYQLPKDSNVNLRVFDVLGREVATLVEGQIKAGYHQVTFEAGNLASGIYIYRLEAEGNVFTKKLSLIK